MAWAKSKLAELDKWFPPAGPCGFCTGSRASADQRHRLWDALLEWHAAGQSVRSLAKDYGLPEAAVRAVIRIRPYRRSKGK